MSWKAQQFVEANLRSALTYQGSDSDRDEVTFRLGNGEVHRLSGDDARAVDAAGHVLRWSHLEGADA